MKPFLSARFFACVFVALASSRADVAVDELRQEAEAAEARFDSRLALQLYMKIAAVRPDDPAVLQKIAQQYSDLVVDLPTNAQKKQSAENALAYAEHAVQLAPNAPVNVLSLAICHGTLAVYSDTRTRIRYSRLVREETERALELDPNYAWAHHVLGRWNYEVATLNSAAKLFVRVIYGGLPDASTRVAVAELSRAVALQPDVLAHQLELGFAYLADGQPEKARGQFQKGLAMPSREKHDEPAKARARAALEALPTS